MLQNVLIIGGGGFIGSHTADELTKKGHKVRIFDQVDSRWIKDSQEMFIGDYLDTKKLNEAMNGVDVVYNFAAIADIGEAADLRKKTIETNIIGVTNTLEAMIKNNVNRLIYSSSMYVYSDKGSFYRATKQAAELLIETYGSKFNIDYTILRYGSLYGSRAQEWNGMRGFIKEILESGVVTYDGTGEETRDYINVSDAAVLSADAINNKFINDAYIISGQQTLKVKDLFNMIFEILGKKSNVKYKKSKSNDHYGNTPYRYSPKSAKKIVPNEFVDLGQGLLDLIEEIDN